MPGGRVVRYREITMQPLFEKEIIMKKLYQVGMVAAVTKDSTLLVLRDVMDVMKTQICSSLAIPEIVEQLSMLGYQVRYEPMSHIENEIASLWIMIGQEEMLLNCQMEPLAVH
ncbi:hypothetical protein DPD00_19640 [Salmonella enterica subsp. enterica serovar Bijlmer]|nr:hypothetical protein [Salmonella enterica subsp. enterica serovar Bijlmer]ECB4197568.1 hypothetical protein [Salmonella enterica subsp. enterica serovar Bijlmer]